MNSAKTLGFVMVILGCGACSGEASQGSSSDGEPVAAVSEPVLNLTNVQKTTALIEMLAAYVPIADKHFTGTSCMNGHYDAVGDGVDDFRGEAGLVYAFATLLHAAPNQATFGSVPRDCLRKQTLATLDDLIAKFPTWGGRLAVDKDDYVAVGGHPYGHWQAPLIAFLMGWGAHVLEDDGLLSVGQITGVANVVKTQANWLIPPNFQPQWYRKGDSHAEDNAWHSSLLALAAAFYGDDPNGVAWDDNAKRYAINASTIESDVTNPTRVDGRALSSWVTLPSIEMAPEAHRWNLENDYTLTNHGFFHPVYSQGVFQNMLDNQIFYKAAGADVPAAFTFRMAEVWTNVMGPLSWNDGDFLCPAATDWVTHDYQHLGYLAGVAATLNRADAAVMESRGIERLKARQLAHGGSLFGMHCPNVAGCPNQIGYETDVLRGVAQTWWIHQLLGPVPDPTPSEYQAHFAEFNGKKQWSPEQKTVTSRGPNAIVSMSWNESDLGLTHPSAYIVPSGEGFQDDPVTLQYWAQSGVGNAVGTAVFETACDSPDPTVMATAGQIAAANRKFSLTSWSDGTTILLDRGTSSTFSFAFESDGPINGVGGLVKSRPVYFADGIHAPTTAGASISGTWANVASRFGYVTRGGLGFFLQDYPDSVHHPFFPNITNPQINVETNGDSTNRNRGALILPLATPQKTALSAVDADLSAVTDSNWSALSGRALDGTGRIAVARWGGGGTATLTLTSSLGAPIPDRPVPVTVTGSSGTTDFSISKVNCSTGFKTYFWATATKSTTIQPISEQLARVTAGAAASTVTVRYADATGKLQIAQRTLSPNELAYARAIDQGLALVTTTASSDLLGHGSQLAYDGPADGGTYWCSYPSPNGQKLRLDFGRPVDMSGLTMTPRPNFGPKDYFIQTSNDGGLWSDPVYVTGASATNSTTTAFTPVKARYVRIENTSAWGSQATNGVCVRGLEIVTPALDLDPSAPQIGVTGVPQMRLAKGGFAIASLTVTNTGASAANVTVSATVPSPIVATLLTPMPISVPAGSSRTVGVRLQGAGATPTSGTSRLTLNASAGSVTIASEAIDLLHTDNLALNEFGAPYPVSFTSKEEPSFLYPPRLATDGDTTGSSNFWVTDLASGAQDLVVSLGGDAMVGNVVFVPRTNYGPKNYTIDTSTAGGGCLGGNWTPRTPTRTATDGATTSNPFTPVLASCVRIHVTSAYGGGPQIRELKVLPN